LLKSKSFVECLHDPQQKMSRDHGQNNTKRSLGVLRIGIQAKTATGLARNLIPLIGDRRNGEKGLGQITMGEL
jgi:hypothetical protein